jgi:hypothetical protein
MSGSKENFISVVLRVAFHKISEFWNEKWLSTMIRTDLFLYMVKSGPFAYVNHALLRILIM